MGCSSHFTLNALHRDVHLPPHSYRLRKENIERERVIPKERKTFFFHSNQPKSFPIETIFKCEIQQNASFFFPQKAYSYMTSTCIYTLNKIETSELIEKMRSPWKETPIMEKYMTTCNVKLCTDTSPGRDCIKTKTSSLNIPPPQNNKRLILPFVSSERYIFKRKISV